MPRFLSPEWFTAATRGRDGPVPSETPAEELVIEQVVTTTPFGDVRYRVVVTAGEAWIELPGDLGAGTGANGAVAAHLTISSDYATACAIAQGQLSTQRALMEGRLRVRGSTAVLSGRSSQLSGLDPVPSDLRRDTTY
jgi:hypothetical protein